MATLGALPLGAAAVISSTPAVARQLQRLRTKDVRQESGTARHQSEASKRNEAKAPRTQRQKLNWQAPNNGCSKAARQH